WKRAKSGDYQQSALSALEALWAQGYRGFLLDDGSALDDAQGDADLSELINAILAQHPEARLVLRNHVQLARTHASALHALVVDSLYHQPGGFAGVLGQTSAVLREKMLQEIRQLQAESALPVIAMDYCGAEDKACRRSLAQQLLQDGVQPFVTAPGMG